MSLQFDPNTQEILFKDRVVGRYTHEAGRSQLQIDISFECDPDTGIVPLCWLASELAQIGADKSTTPSPDLKIETDEDSLTDPLPVVRYLTEKEIKVSSYVWCFHKSDVDQWPSPLHGHAYDHRLKLDAITGYVYDTVTRKHCFHLKKKELKKVHDTLRASKDFAEKAALHLG